MLNYARACVRDHDYDQVRKGWDATAMMANQN